MYRLNKMFDFHKVTFQNIQPITFNSNDLHSLIKLLLFLVLLTCLIYSSLLGDIVHGLFGMVS
jgi:hypothetical protein